MIKQIFKTMLLVLATAGAMNAQTVTSIQVASNISTYSGTCPVVITFKATIYSKGKGSFKYIWERSDGAIDNNNSFVTLGGTGVDVVTTTWTLGAPGMNFSGWESLKVISPVQFTSEKAQFTIKCEGPKGGNGNNNGNGNGNRKNVPSNLAFCDSLPAGYNPMASANLLMNAGFDVTGSLGSPAMHSGSVFNWSAADKWSTWIDHEGPAPDSRAAPGTVFTEMVPSTRPGGDKMIHVKTTEHGEGIVQVFGEYDRGPVKILASAWVYVVSGRVSMGVGNGGNTASTVFTAATGKWEFIQTCNKISPANEIILYGQNSEFYVENARVTIVR